MRVSLQRSLRRLAMMGLFVGVATALGAAPARAQTITGSPANLCTPAPGARTCDDTISWDKLSASYAYYSIWMQIQNQPTGKVNGPVPGQMIACGASGDGAGVGSRAVKLLQSSIYTFTLIGSVQNCFFQLSGGVNNTWLAYTNILVNPLN